MNARSKNIEKEIESLGKTLRLLRGEHGCPWDRDQSLGDIISDLINESYELLEAEKSGDREEIEEELGDVFFLVIFIHELLLEKDGSPLAEIVSRVHEKIINRHPHVFGSTTAGSRIESTAEWERIKRKEKKKRPCSGDLNRIPAEVPPLRKAMMIQKRAAGTGFDWPNHRGILEKFREEIEELEGALESGRDDAVKEEIGDLFFTLVNLARRLDVKPEKALEATSVKFINRFKEMERKSEAGGKSLDSLSLEQMEELWQQSKRDE